MRLPLILLILLLLVNIATDWYIGRVMKIRKVPKWTLKLHWSITALLCVLWCALAFMPIRSGSTELLKPMMLTLGAYFAFYVPKYIFVIFDLVASVPLLFHRKRIKPLSMIGIIIAVIAFGLIWWGILVNRYRTQTIEQNIFIKDLPESFDGYRIVQFSDFHVGTFDRDTTFVKKIVDQINDLHPDMIVFTGDIVSRRTAELIPFVSTLSELHAPDGLFSILGNHDYGDYYDWPSREEKRRNMTLMSELQARMGWHMLNNDHIRITHGTDSIVLIGVENVGDPPFPTYGSLEDAYPTIDDDQVKILLTHNPAHWVNDISGHKDKNIALTLSGHTHAMQMSVMGKSPARLRYKTWGGLYADTDSTHQLYVNIGVGTVGLPARIGATPEITVLTLRPKK